MTLTIVAVTFFTLLGLLRVLTYSRRQDGRWQSTRGRRARLTGRTGVPNPEASVQFDIPKSDSRDVRKDPSES
jgi:hypothetical protein